MVDRINNMLSRLLNKPHQFELLMYRIHLLNELLIIAANNHFSGKRNLEIVPKDGLDGKRLASLQPAELVMVDLPEKDQSVKSWLSMVGFFAIHDSKCFSPDNKNLIGQRYACICKKNEDDESEIYYGKSNLNPKYRYGDST